MGADRPSSAAHALRSSAALSVGHSHAWRRSSASRPTTTTRPRRSSSTGDRRRDAGGALLPPSRTTPRCPSRPPRACLRGGGLSARDLDRVVFYENPYAKLERVLVSLLRTFPRSCRQFPRALGAQLGDEALGARRAREALGVPRERVASADHHRSHAASAFFASPFERAAVLTVDGVGEDTSTAIWRGEGSGSRSSASIEYPALARPALRRAHRVPRLRGERGRVQGHGPRRLRQAAVPRRVRQADRASIADGSFELGLPYFALPHRHRGRLRAEARGAARPAARARQPLGPRRARAEDRRYADVAATLQAVTEDALLALARAGAAAHRRRRALPRRRRRAQRGRQRAHPARGGLRARVRAARGGRRRRRARRGDPRRDRARRSRARPPAHRRARDGASSRTTRDRRSRRGSVLDRAVAATMPAVAAELLARGRSWPSRAGRFEWGPRALGQRSILAAPRDAGDGASGSTASSSARAVPPVRPRRAARTAPSAVRRARRTT